MARKSHTSTGSPEIRSAGDRGLEYDQQIETYRVEYDWSDVVPSTAVLEAVASLKGEDPTDLEPLHEHVNTDALDALLTADVSRAATSVSFEFVVDTITVHGDGTVAIHRPDEHPQ